MSQQHEVLEEFSSNYQKDLEEFQKKMIDLARGHDKLYSGATRQVSFPQK